MAEQGDLQAPAWLQRNWQPREPFDPTPWLQERYRRQQDAQILPLKLQQMELANKAAQLQIEHQGIENDIVNLDMNAYRDDLSRIRAFREATGGDPLKMAETPPPALFSAKGQQTLANQIKQASQVGYVQRHQDLETAKFALATKAAEHGYSIPMTTDPVTGQPSFDTQAIADTFSNSALRDLVGKAFLATAKGSAREADVRMLNDAKSALASAQASKDPNKIAAAQQNLQSVMEAMPGQSVTVFDPKTGQPVVQMGKATSVSGDLTTSATTEEQKQIMNSEQTVGDLIRTREQLNNNDVAGIWPTVKNQFFDKLMGNVAPDFVSKERVAGRAAINWSRQDVINQMRQRYGEHAVERISNMLPSTSMNESPEDARILADAAIKTIALDSAKRAFNLGRAPAEHVLRAISRIPNDELDKEISSGYIPPALAIAAIKIRKLPPGQMPEGLPSKQTTGQSLTVSPDSSSSQAPGKVTWEQLFKLYKSGKLRDLSPSEGTTGEE